MNPRDLNDTQLIAKTDIFVKEEREILALILRCFCEIERRRLFSDYKMGSMYAFLIERYNYSSDQVYRRLDAMRLLRELPEIEEKIISGDLNLTHLNMAHTHFRQERNFKKPLAREEKLEVLDKIANQSIVKTKEIVCALSSNPEAILRPDRVETINENQIELTFTASKVLREKIAKLRGHFAHKSPNMKLGELFEKLCDLQIAEFEKANVASAQKAEAALTRQPVKPSVALTRKPLPRKAIPAHIKRAVFARAKHQCEICKSTYALDTDHVTPVAKGGTDELENLRALCRQCNQRQAIRHFGGEKMDLYLWRSI